MENSLNTYYGYLPSEHLKSLIESADQAMVDSSSVDKRRDIRDRLVKQIVNELIQTMMKDLVAALPPGDKRTQMEKVTDTVASTSEKLIGQILGKDGKEVLDANHEFLVKKTLFKDSDGQARVCFLMKPELDQRIVASLDRIEQGHGKEEQENIIRNVIDLTDAILDHFMMGFAQTLDLGFIKRKLLPIAQSAISGGVNMMTKRLFPKLGQAELERFAVRYKPLFFRL